MDKVCKLTKVLKTKLTLESEKHTYVRIVILFKCHLGSVKQGIFA